MREEQEDADSCAIYPAYFGHGATFVMLEQNRVTRVEIKDATLTTPAGIGIGSTVAQLKKVYGARLKAERPYDNGPQDWSYYLWSKSGNGIRFDASNGRIHTIYAGNKAIRYYEGCY